MKTTAVKGSTVRDAVGTKIKFTPLEGTDRNYQGFNINTMHQCITCMKEYENKSFEELRFEDSTIHSNDEAIGAPTRNTFQHAIQKFSEKSENQDTEQNLFPFNSATTLSPVLCFAKSKTTSDESEQSDADESEQSDSDESEQSDSDESEQLNSDEESEKSDSDENKSIQTNFIGSLFEKHSSNLMVASVVGTLFYVPSSRKFTWIAFNFTSFALPYSTYYRVSSSFFDFGAARWCLWLYPNGLSTIDPGHVILALVLQSTYDQKLSVHWKLKVKRLIDKKLLKEFHFQWNFKEKRFQCKYLVLPIKVSDTREPLLFELSPKGCERSKEVSSQTEPTLRTDKLVQDLKGLLLSGDSSDATIQVKGQEFLVHKIILGARTSVFSSMFKHEMSESASGIVKIDDCDPDIFQRFLNYLYYGSVGDLTVESAIRLYEVAAKYQVEELKVDCLECTKKGLSTSSFCCILTLALKHCESELIKLATEFFRDNIKQIILTVEWQRFLCENPIQSNELLIKALENFK